MMMLTVDKYYDWYLKGKSLPEIMREIEKLRKTMASLKSKMESPKYNKENSCWSIVVGLMKKCRYAQRVHILTELKKRMPRLVACMSLQKRRRKLLILLQGFL